MAVKRRRKIKLKKPRDISRMSHSSHETCAWEKSWPFVANPRGVLVHRVRSILQFTWTNEPFKGDQHCHADYWCENGCNFHPDDHEIVLVRDPGDRILCARCEGMAIANGQKSAEELAGHHVHIGGIRAVRFCCNGSHN